MAKCESPFLLHENDGRVPNELKYLSEIGLFCPVQVRRKKNLPIIFVDDTGNTYQHAPKLFMLELDGSLLKLLTPSLSGVRRLNLNHPMIFARNSQRQCCHAGLAYSELNGQESHRVSI